MKGNLIALTTIYAARSEAVPDTPVHIDECTPVCVQPIPNLVLGYYGTQGKNGCAAAGQMCLMKGLYPHLVSINTLLDKPLLKSTIRRSNLPDTEFVNVMRASRDLMDNLADFWYAGLEKKGFTKSQLEKIDWSSPSRFIPRHEDLIADLLEVPEWQHIKVIAYPAAPQTGVQRGVDWFMTGAVRKQDITDAHFTFHPEVPVIVS